MSAGRGVANLIITDKRSDGYPTAHGWGLDFPLERLDRVVDSARQLPEWDLDHIHPVPEIGAAILACHAGSVDMALADWNQVISSYWKEVQPPGRIHKWLKWYDARADYEGQLRSTFRWPKNPTFRLSFLRAQPPATQTEIVFFALTLNALGTVQYQLYFTQLLHETDPGLTNADIFFPKLLKSTDSGATWEVVDRFTCEQASRWSNDAFERLEVVYCRFLDDHLVISLGEIGRNWIYYEEGLEIPEGHVQFDCGGGQIAFHAKLATYMPTGTIERKVKITPPDFINDVADSVDYTGDPGDAGGVSVSMETGSGQIWPKAILVASSPRYYTPVISNITARRPSVHAAPVATVLFDNVAVGGDQGKIIEADFTVASRWRGSTFNAALRTTQGADEYDFSGNEKAQLKVALDLGAGISYTTQVTGYLEVPRIGVDGRDPNQIILQLAARDRLCRLDNKRAWACPAFDGWTFEDAFTWLLHERGGVPTADLLLDAEANAYTLPTRSTGGLRLKFDHTATIVQAADELARAAGRRWGINQLGQVFAELDLPLEYGGSPDFILDDDAVSDQDKIYWVEFERDLFSLRNHVLILGEDADGNEVMASWRATNSLSDPTFLPYIGDDWWEVALGPAGCDPWVAASLQGQEMLEYRGLLTWETDGKPTLFPDHFVEVQAAHLGVPAGTIFRIIEKYGRFTEDGAFTTRFAGLAL